MSGEIEKKIIQLGYLHDSLSELEEFKSTMSDFWKNNKCEQTSDAYLFLVKGKSAIEQAIISISQELVELYETEKEKRGVDMLSE